MKWNKPLLAIRPSETRRPTSGIPWPAGRGRRTRRQHGLTLAALLLTGGLLLAGPAAALESDQQQPIYMEADGVEINDGSGASIYQGNVVVTQGSIRMTADQVTVTRRPSGADHIVAIGNPTTFQQQMEGKKELIKGRSRRAEYTTDSEVIVLIGDAVLTQAKDMFKSDRIIYNRIKGQVLAGNKAQGKQRVRVTIQPKKATQQGDE